MEAIGLIYTGSSDQQREKERHAFILIGFATPFICVLQTSAHAEVLFPWMSAEKESVTITHVSMHWCQNFAQTFTVEVFTNHLQNSL